MFLAGVLLMCGLSISAAQVLSPDAFLQLRRVTIAEVSPDGESIAYLVDVPRLPSDEPGASYSELHVYSRRTGTLRPFISGKVRVGTPEWSPDGTTIAFTMKRGEKAQTQVWTISTGGGEAVQLTNAEEGVLSFHWHPSGKSVGYVAVSPRTSRERQLENKGYRFVFYEENVHPRTLFMVNTDGTGEPMQLTEQETVWSFAFSPDGKSAAVAMTAKNLIDENYMFQKIYLLSIGGKTKTLIFSPPGKLGVFAFNPDGTSLAVAAAKERSDHAVSQAFVVSVTGGAPLNVTPQKYRGHINWVGWRDSRTLVYRAGEGVHTTLSTVRADGSSRELLLSSERSGIVFGNPSLSAEFKAAALVGQSPTCPGDLYFWAPGSDVQRLTIVAPELRTVSLGTQSVIRYKARDGVEIEGLLLSPAGFEKGKRYPLVVVVHGGPESHYSNGWPSSYSEPGQVLAGKGYAVFFPNYRASTGYGVEFANAGLGDPAGKEFDDIADGMDYLVAEGIADRERIGLCGGSYGGYAAAWFATYYTRYVRAVVMFVGVSNLISRRGTTDIPYEELYVHSGKPLEEMWDVSLKRSPITWAKQSSTATLICGGTDDTRVHPSQSLELYRIMKTNNHPAVRLVQYPGEQHGNAKQPGRIDIMYRTLDWFDWYVMEAKPLQGPMPPLDISDKYGVTW
jgi:dipeptidyl aminopeptidase/acylaminoacyl peptidase